MTAQRAGCALTALVVAVAGLSPASAQAEPGRAIQPTALTFVFPSPTSDVVVDEAENHAYVAAGDTVHRIDLADGSLDKRYRVGAKAFGIDLSPDGSTLFATRFNKGSVAMFDLATGQRTIVRLRNLLGHKSTYDVRAITDTSVLVTAAPNSSGTAFVVEFDPTGISPARRVASSRIIRADPRIATDGARVYVGERFSPASLYKLAGPDYDLVREDDHGSVGGTTLMSVSPDGEHIVLGSGQVLRTFNLKEIARIGSGVPEYSEDGTVIHVVPNGAQTIETYSADTHTLLAVQQTGCTNGQPREMVALSNDRFIVAGLGRSVCLVGFETTLECAGTRATIVATKADDKIEGTAFDDVILAGNGDDEVDGLGGSDIVCGGNGRDIITIRSNTEAYGGRGLDTADFSRLSHGVSFDLITDIVTSRAGDISAIDFENVVGTDFDDVIRGSGRRNVISGGGGDDLIAGRGGRDLLDGDDGQDVLLGGARDDVIRGGEEYDIMLGGPGDDFMDGGGHFDAVSYERSRRGVDIDLRIGSATGEGTDVVLSVVDVVGSPRRDTLIGDGNHNILIGLDGADDIQGLAGNDLISGGEKSDVLDGGPGVDRITFELSSARVVVDLSTRSAVGAGNDTVLRFERVHGTPFNDILRGDGASNALYGLAGNDTLEGRADNDLLVGGPGTDVANGGPGDFDDCRSSETNISCEFVFANSTDLGRDAGDDRFGILLDRLRESAAPLP